MKQRLLIAVISVALLAVIGIGLVALLPRGVAATDTTIPVNVNVNDQQGIWVNGQGSVTVVPDIAIANLGVSAQSSTVADALAQASAAMDNIMAALTSNGIDTKDIQTNYFNIQQIINNYPKDYILPAPAPMPPSDMGSSSSSSGSATITPTIEPVTSYLYQVNNTVTVKIRAIDKVGTIIDAVAEAGGDLTRINGVSFAVEKPDQYYAQARQAAMTDAQARAQQLAQLSEVSLGKAFYISENSYLQPIYYPAAMTSYSFDGRGTSLSPGQTDIVLNIQVAYTIQ